MTTDTKGWDLVAGITQSALNREVAKLFAKGYLPSHIQQSIDIGIISGSIDLTLGCVTINLGGVTTGMAILSLPVTKGKLSVKGVSDFIMDGAVITVSTAVNQIEVETEQKEKQIRIYIDLLSEQTSIVVKVKGPKLTPQQEAVLNALLNLFFASLSPGKYYVGSVTLSGISVPVYLMPKTAAFSLVPNSTSGDLNELIILVKTLGSGGKKPYTDSVVPKNTDVVLLMSNERLLSNVVGGALAEQMKGATFTYSDNDYHMTNSVPFDKYQLRGARVSVTKGAIHIKLDIAAMHQAGGGINIYVKSDTSITVSYDTTKKQFVPTSTTPTPDTSWDLEWWVYLIAGLVAVLIGLVAGIVAIIVSVVVGAIANAVAAPEAGKAIDKIFKDALIPIKWPGDAFLVPSSVNFPDSLQISGKLS
jgi:Clostridium P-47 protein.